MAPNSLKPVRRGVDGAQLVPITMLLVTDLKRFGNTSMSKKWMSPSAARAQFFRVVLELHLLDQLQAVLSVVCRSHRERNVEFLASMTSYTRPLSVIKNLLDELHQRPGMDLLADVEQ